MNINFQQGAPLKLETDCLIAGLFEGDEFSSGILVETPHSLVDSLRTLYSKGELTGKSGNSTLIHTLGNAVPLRIMFLGLGKRESMTESTIRDALGSAVRKARGIGVTSIAVAVDLSLIHI